MIRGERIRGAAADTVTVGRYTYGLDLAVVHQWGEGARLSIGAFCSFGANCQIYLGGNHQMQWVSTFPFAHRDPVTFSNFRTEGQPTTKGNVVIGNDVWVGNDVTLMSGVHVGDGAVLAARSHVVKDVAPYAVVGGNPARLLRFRFTPEQIDQLLRLQWWNWDVKTLNRHAELFRDVEGFLRKFQ